MSRKHWRTIYFPQVHDYFQTIKWSNKSGFNFCVKVVKWPENVFRADLSVQSWTDFACSHQRFPSRPLFHISVAKLTRFCIPHHRFPSRPQQFSRNNVLQYIRKSHFTLTVLYIVFCRSQNKTPIWQKRKNTVHWDITGKYCVAFYPNKLPSLEATLVQNYNRLTDRVECRATSGARNWRFARCQVQTSVDRCLLIFWHQCGHIVRDLLQNICWNPEIWKLRIIQHSFMQPKYGPDHQARTSQGPFKRHT